MLESLLQRVSVLLLLLKLLLKRLKNYVLTSMGQKTHPVGLRLGLHRKWSSSWLISGLSTTESKYSSVVSTRGGAIRSNREDIICSFLRRLPSLAQSRSSSSFKKTAILDTSSSESQSDQTSSESVSSFVPVDLQLVVGSGGSLFVVFLYSKLQGHN